MSDGDRQTVQQLRNGPRPGPDTSTALRLMNAAQRLTRAATSDDLLQILAEEARAVIGAERAVARLAGDSRRVDQADGATAGQPGGASLVLSLTGQDGLRLGAVELVRMTATFDAEEEALLAGLAALAADRLETLDQLATLQAAEARFRTLFDKSPQPMWLYDRATLAFLEVNEAMVACYGWSRAELARMVLTDIRPPEEVPRLLSRLAVQGNGLSKGEWRHRTRDGRALDMMIASFPVTFGGRAACLAVATDISERKRNEQALRDSATRLRLAQRLARMGDWVWRPSPDGWGDGPVEYSDEAAALLGVPAGGLALTADAFIERFVHPDDRERATTVFAASTLPGSPGYSLKYRIRRADDAVRVVHEISENVVRDGVLVETRGTMQDVTEQETLEAQLRQAQKMEALGQLTGGVAHDFNNLLTVIIGNTEQLCEELAEARPELSTLCLVTLGAAQRGAALTGRLLAFSRQRLLQAQLVDLSQLLGGIEPLLRRMLGEAIDLTLAIQEGLPPLLLDPDQLEHAVINLVVNARDASGEQGRLTLTATALELDAAAARALPDLRPGRYVTLALSDQGSGMPREVAERAFEPFFSTKEVGKGSGLGLSMVYGFARQSGGCATIDSEPGQGTTVRLYLPAAEAALAARPAETRRATVADADQAVILVVEDDDAIRRLVVTQLQQLGHHTLEAMQARAAEAILRSPTRVDLLLSDVVMPGGVGGLELARLALRLRPTLRCLLMSGYAEGAVEPGEAERERIHFLAKPFRKQGLVEAVAAALGHGEAAATTSA